MTHSPGVGRIIGWLRAGYPEGVPDVDELANESDPESAEAIRQAIKAVTSYQQSTDGDINRVRARLAAGGWPLAPPDQIT